MQLIHKILSRKWTVLLILLFPSLCFAQGAHRISQVLVRGNGVDANVAPFATIKVCTSGTHCATVATIYSDLNLTQTLRQPVIADASGNYSYYVPTGCYDELVSVVGSQPLLTLNVCLVSGASGTGSVTNVSVVTANGFQGTVANSTTTPAITISPDSTHYFPTTTDESNWNSKLSSVTLANVGAGASPTGLFDFSGATQLKLPSAAGYTAAASAEIGYDTTNLNVHFNVASTDLIMLGVPSASLPTNGHCAQFTQIGAWYELTDVGFACGAGGGGSGTVTTVSVTTANGVSATVANATTTPALTFTLGAITPSQVTTGFVTTTGNAACTGCGGGDTLTEGIAPSGAFIGAGLDTYWADSATHHLATNLNNGGTSYVPNVVTPGTSGDLVIFGADGITIADGGAVPTGGISGQVAGFIPIAATSTTLTGPSPIDFGITAAGIVTVAAPEQVTCATCPPGIIIGPANSHASIVTTATWTLGMPSGAITGQTWVAPSTPASGAVTVVNTSGVEQLAYTPLQGTDTNLLTSGTVSGTAASLCTDANGGATTVGCTTGGSSVGATNVIQKVGSTAGSFAAANPIDNGTTFIATEAIQANLTGSVAAVNFATDALGTGMFSTANTNLQFSLNGTQGSSLTTAGWFLKTGVNCWGSSFTACSAGIGISSSNSYLNAYNSVTTGTAPTNSMATLFDFHAVAAIPSAATFVPTAGLINSSGTTAITAITNPTGLSTTLGTCFIDLPSGAWTWTAGGNIANSGTATSGTPVLGCFFGTAWTLVSLAGGGGSGVTNIATTGPISGGPITSTGTISCPTCGVTGSGLNQFAATTSAQLAGVISDETGTGALVFGTAPTITLANGTGLPIASGVSGLGTGVATFLATPSSANLAAALTDETGTGAAVFATSPTLVTPVLGVATATSVNGTTIPSSVTLTQTVASGTLALGTSAIASGACATVATATATGTASTDSIIWNPNASIKAVTGYTPATTGGLTIALFPSTNLVSADVCNWSSASITPGAVTLNWRVTR